MSMNHERAERILIAIREYEAECTRARRAESQRIYRHSGASIPWCAPTDAGRLEAIRKVLNEGMLNGRPQTDRDRHRTQGYKTRREPDLSPELDPFPWETHTGARLSMGTAENYKYPIDFAPGAGYSQIIADYEETNETDIREGYLDPMPWEYRGIRGTEQFRTLGYQSVFKPRPQFSQNRMDYK